MTYDSCWQTAFFFFWGGIYIQLSWSTKVAILYCCCSFSTTGCARWTEVAVTHKHHHNIRDSVQRCGSPAHSLIPKRFQHWKRSVARVLVIQPDTQMFREQSSFRGVLHEEAIITTDLRIKSETKGKRNGILFLPHYSHVVRCWVHKSCVTLSGKQWWGRTNSQGEDSAANRTHTSYIIRTLLKICSVAAHIPCWCEHMGKGRGSISSVKTGGEDVCCTIQSRAGLYKEQNTLVNSLNSWHRSSVMSWFHTVTSQDSYGNKFWQVDP